MILVNSCTTDYDALDSSALSCSLPLSIWSLVTKGRRMNYLLVGLINGGNEWPAACLIANATEVGGFLDCEGKIFLWVSSACRRPSEKLLAYGDSVSSQADAHCYGPRGLSYAVSLVYLRLNAYLVVVLGDFFEMDGFWVGLNGPLICLKYLCGFLQSRYPAGL
ncbi:hypothetical protein Nepgr_033735 [Nepenthes gracilis]|uniref:Uncharacterized protein n=1 Tax=Nepenthes gracilis TaxID=150966 RepID=A0AAD3Y943_NEPGR|nr:hypothetical protein Nepgr_033735 [Nepenthes gracilis]